MLVHLFEKLVTSLDKLLGLVLIDWPFCYLFQCAITQPYSRYAILPILCYADTAYGDDVGMQKLPTQAMARGPSNSRCQRPRSRDGPFVAPTSQNPLVSGSKSEGQGQAYATRAGALLPCALAMSSSNGNNAIFPFRA
jgi:hypothetical protein